jgi:hypothetical protein
MKIDELHAPLIEDNNNIASPTKLEKTFERIDSLKQLYFEGNGSIIGSIFCLLCLTFGSGILALPYSFAQLGIGLGLALYLLASYCVYLTMGLLTKTAYRHNILSYSKLINLFYGYQGVLVYEIMNLLSNIGTMIVYQQISKLIVLNLQFLILLKAL